MTYKEAVRVLHSAVKESHLDGQRHIDLSVVTADRRGEAVDAMMWVRTYIARGEVTELQLKRIWGLNRMSQCKYCQKEITWMSNGKKIFLSRTTELCTSAKNSSGQGRVLER